MSLRAPIGLYQYRGHVLTSPPAAEPVTAAQLRAHLRETETGLPDDEANAFIAVAREYAEEMTGLAMITQTWRLALDHWPAARAPWWDGVRQGSIAELYGPESASDVELPRYPLRSVSSVTVFDEAGNSSAVTVASVFDVDTYRRPGRMALKRGATWPIALRAVNAIQIDYIAGYGDNAAAVPAAIKEAIKKMAAYLYANRGDGCGCETAAADTGAMAMLSAYKVARI